VRALAAIGDYISVGALVFAIFLGVGSTGGVVEVAVAVVVLIVYACVSEALFGRTIWKAAFGLRVVSADGSPLTAGQAITRNVLRLVDILPLFYGVGGLVLLATGRGQRLGDIAARTLVVRWPPTAEDA